MLATFKTWLLMKIKIPGNVRIIGISFDCYLITVQYNFAFSRIFIRGKWTPFIWIGARNKVKLFMSD